MGDMADDLMDRMDALEDGYETFEERLDDIPPFLWLANSGERYVIAKMERGHIRNTIWMLGQWVREGRGSNEAEIVGVQRWKNLLKRFDEA